jgi:2-methylcitrate dehydratase
LFYAAAIIYPEQYKPERINRVNVQALLRKILVSTGFPHEPVLIAEMLDPYNLAYPDEMRAKVEISMKDGRTLEAEKTDYHCFFTRPFSWENPPLSKFNRLTSDLLSGGQQATLITIIKDLDQQPNMAVLTDFLSKLTFTQQV